MNEALLRLPHLPCLLLPDNPQTKVRAGIENTKDRASLPVDRISNAPLIALRWHLRSDLVGGLGNSAVKARSEYGSWVRSTGRLGRYGSLITAT